MDPYTFPDFSSPELLRIFFKRRELATGFINRLKAESKAHAIYIRKKERYVLASILDHLGWKNKKIALPAFLCRVMSDTIVSSGNIPVFYDVNDDLNINPSHINEIQNRRIDAFIISEVYGIQVKVPDFIFNLKPHPILIGDFAHRDSFIIEEQDHQYDILLYSSAYYKPMKSSGMGIGLILNKDLNLENSMNIERHLFMNMWSMIKLLLIKQVITTWIIGPIYKKTIRSRKKSTTRDIFHHQPASEMSLAQVSDNFVDRSSARSGIRSGYEKMLTNLDGVELIGLNSPRHPTYITVKIEDIDRDRIIYKMLSHGILAGRIFADPMDLPEDKYPVAVNLAAKVLNLPVQFIKKSPEEIVNILRMIINECKNDI